MGGLTSSRPLPWTAVDAWTPLTPLVRIVRMPNAEYVRRVNNNNNDLINESQHIFGCFYKTKNAIIRAISGNKFYKKGCNLLLFTSDKSDDFGLIKRKT